MNASPEPGVLTTARIEKFRALYCPDDGPEVPFVSGCPWCGLSGMLHRPCAGGRTWTSRCRACGVRLFVQHPRQLYATVALIGRVATNGDGAVVRFLYRLEQLGHRALTQASWEPALVGGRSVQQIPTGQACLCCGEAHTLMVRKDRHGRPYGSCSACTARMFWRHSGGLHCALGWTVWLQSTGHDAAWWEAFQTGKGIWSSWMAPAHAETSPTAAAQDDAAIQETA